MKPVTLSYHYKRRTHRQQTRLSNIVLMPASLLAQKARFASLTSSLPTGRVLILNPTPVFSKQRQVLSEVARFLRISGHLVRAI